MSDEVRNLLSKMTAGFDKAIEHLGEELAKLRAGKANPQMLDGVFVEYYGNNVPLTQVGNVSTPDAKSLVIQPWEKNMLHAIEKAITYANLGYNPTNDGNVVRIILPPLTEERRRQLVKMAKAEGEGAKVAIRTLRKESNEAVKKLVKSGLPEDEGKKAELKVQEFTDKYVIKIDQVVNEKEKEIMTI